MMNAIALATNAATVEVTTTWKLIAVGIGIGLLVLLWLVIGVSGGPCRFWELAQGADKSLSTSKFQWLLWLVVILFAYVVLWVIRARAGDYSAITDVPANLMTVLGLSAATAVAAKGITVGYLGSGKIDKTAPANGDPKGGLLNDDSGFPELAKVQLIGFTLIAVGIFLATLFHQIHGKSVQTELRDIDSSLLVLMGLSQGGYVGKKLVSIATPVLYAPPSPASAARGAAVVVNGASLGPSQGATQLLFDGYPIPATNWSDNAITFNVPQDYPGGQNWPAAPVRIAVDVGGGRRSNEVLLTVTP
jgi:IPT/TIG domain